MRGFDSRRGLKSGFGLDLPYARVAKLVIRARLKISFPFIRKCEFDSHPGHNAVIGSESRMALL